MSTRNSRMLRIALVPLLALLAVSAASAGTGTLYDVTVTNLTHGQILSPPVAVAHNAGFRVFRSGTPASPELAALAEDADSAGLIALLGTQSRVNDVNIAGDVVLPGGSQTVQIELDDNFRTLTVLSMLVTTNDAFFSGTSRVALNGASFTAPAYDAGSEANTQDCAHIPGPPCGNPNVRVTDGAEGFIYISSGVHAGGGLDPAVHDWRNPVARITVRLAR